jgi:hypothetical protein
MRCRDRTPAPVTAWGEVEHEAVGMKLRIGLAAGVVIELSHQKSSGRFTDSAAHVPLLSLTAEREILAPSFRLITRFRHINIRNTLSRSEYVFPVLSITLRSHQFVVKPRCGGSSSRQWKGVCDFYPLVLGFLGDLRCRNEPPLCLFMILRLLKC